MVVLCALLTGLILAVARPWIVRAYTDEAQVAALALALLHIAPWAHFCDAMHCVSAYVLRAYKVAMAPMLIQTVALIGIGLLGGWWLAYGPAAGALAPVAQWLSPGAPAGAATMWIMTMAGLAATAASLFAWYGRVLRRFPPRQDA